eukprot:128004-Rhodomonas_salina.1
MERAERKVGRERRPLSQDQRGCGGTSSKSETKKVYVPAKVGETNPDHRTPYSESGRESDSVHPRVISVPMAPPPYVRVPLAGARLKSIVSSHAEPATQPRLQSGMRKSEE